MKIRNSDTENEDNTSSDSTFDSYTNELKIYLSNLEKIGALFLSLGYFSFVEASDLDILDILDINTSGKSAELLFFQGQLLTVIGYAFLWRVASNRVYLFTLTGENNIAAQHQKLSQAYIISIFANLIRLEAFYDLYIISLQEESSAEDNDEDSTK